MFGGGCEVDGMSATPSQTHEREHLLGLLRHFRVAVLVTYADDRLRARPMAIARVDDDGRIWFFTGRQAAKVHEIEANTRVHVVCQNDNNTCLSLSGQARLHADRSLIADLWQEPFRVWFPDGKDDPDIELIDVRPDEGEYWDNEGFNRMKYLFHAAKAYATGTIPPFDEGKQHGVAQL